MRTATVADQVREPAGRRELVYVSWGGTGRATTVREAMRRAGASGRDLVYLAILDDSAFGDVDPTMLELAREELAWLLDAQLELTRSQTGLDDLSVRVLVRTGDVADRICELVDGAGEREVLIGAPGPLAGDDQVTGLVDVVRRRVPVPVELIEP
jgi:hypothetical protein